MQKSPEDVRLGDIIQEWIESDAINVDVGILGVPFERGVELSGGRTGTISAPDAIRAQLERYGTAYNIERDADLRKLKIADAGNVQFLSERDEPLDIIFEFTDSAFDYADTLIIIGGGHDVSSATIRALSKRYSGKVGGMNVDAHLDARIVIDGKIKSGCPYRILIEDGHLVGDYFFEVGIQGHVNSKADSDWLKTKGAEIIFLGEMRKRGVSDVFERFIRMTEDCEALFVSIDIDAVAQAFAPGSSAPSPDGLFPEDVLELAYLAGENPKVRLFEIMEVNPLYDIDSRTSRLAANIIHEFLAGRSILKQGAIT